MAEARRAGVPDAYGGSYFGEGRDALGDREGRSGYARYDRVASNADIAGWLLWRNLRVTTSLDVGCATGYLVEVLHERGIDAQGCDLSPYAIDHAAPGAVGHVRVANLFAGLPWPDGAFDLVTSLEILEHLPPDSFPGALCAVSITNSGACGFVPSNRLGSKADTSSTRSRTRRDMTSATAGANRMPLRYWPLAT